MNSARHRIVVGVDGSPASLGSVRYAELLAAELEAATSWAAPGAYGGGLGVGSDAVDVDWQAVAEQTQQTALAEALGEHTGTVRSTTVRDHPAAALVDAAEGADLLVVRSRGHGGFTGMLLGSVSAHFVTHASCPVLVIRSTADRDGATVDTDDQLSRPSKAPTPILAGGQS